MTNSERIQANNEALEEAIALANSLPDAGAVIEPLSVTKNGTYTAPTGVDGYSPVSVNVPVPEGYIKPSGTLNITKNGSHDVTQYAGVNVNVPVGVTVQTKVGTFTTDDSGFYSVNCGFVPDFFGIHIMLVDNEYENDMFFTPTSGFTSGPQKIACSHTPEGTMQGSCFAYDGDEGIGVYGWLFAHDWTWSNTTYANNRTFQFAAVKCT